MSILAKSEVTRTLNGLSTSGTPSDAVNQLMPMVYTELRDIAGRYFLKEDADHTLQPTALVHEAFLKMVNIDQIDWQGKTHFYAISAKTMRRILVDHARKKKSLKRGGDIEKVLLEDGVALSNDRSCDVLAVEEALQALEQRDPRAAEIVELRFFGGMTEVEVAESIGLSRRTVQGEWRMAKAWLRKFMSDVDEGN